MQRGRMRMRGEGTRGHRDSQACLRGSGVMAEPGVIPDPAPFIPGTARFVPEAQTGCQASRTSRRTTEARVPPSPRSLSCHPPSAVFP